MNTTVFWIVQALGILSTIVTCFSFVQKEKWKLMLFLVLTNALYSITYFLSGTLTGGLLVLGALARTIVYFIYSKINRKPDFIVVIMFELYNIVLSIVLWNSVFDLLLICNLAILTFTTWQNNIKLLRLSYICSSFLLIPYNILIGAYTNVLSELVMLASVIYAIVKYSKTTKDIQDINNKYFQANKNFWGIKTTSHENFDLISNEVDDSSYYNFCILKNHNNLTNTFLEIKEECKRNQMKEIVYLPVNSNHFDDFSKIANTIEMFFPTEFHDVWMKLEDGLNLNNTKCKINGIEFKEIKEDKIQDLIDVYIQGYMEKTNLDKLTKKEKARIEFLKNTNLTDTVDGYKITAYVGYFYGKPCSLVVMLSSKVEAFISKVSTIPALRRKHIASSLIQYAIDKQRTKGVQNFLLVTDKNSINEKFYKFNNFNEIGQGYALNIEDLSKFEEFVQNTSEKAIVEK